MAAVDDDDGCPECGSHSCRRLFGPDERSSDVENLDVSNSGTYSCNRCKTEFYVETENDEPDEKPILFSPTARCPRCKSFRTITKYTNPTKNQRAHSCKACNHAFLTSKADIE